MSTVPTRVKSLTLPLMGHEIFSNKMGARFPCLGALTQSVGMTSVPFSSNVGD